MDLSKLVLKRPVNLKVIVTPAWQEEVQKQLQGQIGNIDKQMQQLEQQAQKAIAEVKKQASLQAPQQIENINSQVNQKKNEMLQQKNQLLQQMQQVQLLELGQEVMQAQMESFFEVQQGDNLVEKMNIEIVMRDGIIEEIRGSI
jgi:Skp family chaperone for outer membrane proteins